MWLLWNDSVWIFNQAPQLLVPVKALPQLLLSVLIDQTLTALSQHFFSALCNQWLWGSRNSTQDPLTPISSPGASMPPSMGQISPIGPPVVLSPGQIATRWDQAWSDYTPPCMGEQGLLLHGRLLLFSSKLYSPVLFSGWFSFLHFFRVGIAVLKNYACVIVPSL